MAATTEALGRKRALGHVAGVHEVATSTSHESRQLASRQRQQDLAHRRRLEIERAYDRGGIEHDGVQATFDGPQDLALGCGLGVVVGTVVGRFGCD